MPSPRDALVAMAAAAATLTSVSLLPHLRGNHVTTLGRPKAKGEKAFMLSVGLKFQDSATAVSFLRAWGKAADYCIAHEPFLFAYEVAQSDQGAP